VGYDEGETAGLYSTQCIVGSLSGINGEIPEGRVEAQPRYRAKSESVTVKRIADDKVELEFLRPQRALTPGQICAFYEGGKLLGG